MSTLRLKTYTGNYAKYRTKCQPITEHVLIGAGLGQISSRDGEVVVVVVVDVVVVGQGFLQV